MMSCNTVSSSIFVAINFTVNIINIYNGSSYTIARDPK